MVIMYCNLYLIEYDLINDISCLGDKVGKIIIRGVGFVLG